MGCTLLVKLEGQDSVGQSGCSVTKLGPLQWSDFVMWFGEIELCDPTILSKFAEDDSCRCDVFSSHWVAGKTAGGCPPCSTFKYWYVDND